MMHPRSRACVCAPPWQRLLLAGRAGGSCRVFADGAGNPCRVFTDGDGGSCRVFADGADGADGPPAACLLMELGAPATCLLMELGPPAARSLMELRWDRCFKGEFHPGACSCLPPSLGPWLLASASDPRHVR